MMKNDHYVYILLDPRILGPFIFLGRVFHCEPFYIGKGKGSRDKSHVSRARRGLHPYSDRANRIRDILFEDREPVILHLHTNLLNRIALRLEKVCVNKVGRLNIGTGPLLNKCAGGSGDYKSPPDGTGVANAFYGRQPTKAIEASIRARTGKPHSDERKKIISVGVLKVRHKLSQGHIDRLSRQIKETFLFLLENRLEINEFNYDNHRPSKTTPLYRNRYKFVSQDEMR